MASFQQYRVHAYVCGNACVQHVDNMGTVTFTWVFLHRPLECRYAIVSRWNRDKLEGDVMVLDMYETQESARTGKLIMPEPVRVCDSVDAAIMATAMLYEED